MPLARDLLHPDAEQEARTHKLKRLIPAPNSLFMDVKCPNASLKDCKTKDLITTLRSCYRIQTLFSHTQTVVRCSGCSMVLCQPTGGKTRLVEGCAFRPKKA